MQEVSKILPHLAKQNAGGESQLGDLRACAKFTLIAATCKNGFIAAPGHVDANLSRGDFSSQADKEHLRQFLRGESDLCVMGRVTYQHFAERLTKYRVIVFSNSPRLDLRGAGHEVFSPRGDSDEISLLQRCAAGDEPRRVTILGGSQVYTWFLKRGLVDRAYITTEKSVDISDGLPLHTLPSDPFNSAERRYVMLDQQTVLTEYIFRR